ncbi:MAG TPA: hypothetical protein ENL03_04070 [Phycisphaerae bacterium]|nr:hypothetical protein [Phycisphaerae bacterium]
MTEQLAINGGDKAVGKLGPHQGKLHIEELEGLLDLWKYPAGVKEEIVELIRKNAAGIEAGHMFRYYKILNCGEGGFVTTNDEWLYTRAQSWHDCAACWRPDRYASERKEGAVLW